MQLAFTWRFLISVLIAGILITMVWLTSQFKEPPQINAMVLLFILITHAVFELINGVQKLAFSRLSVPAAFPAAFRIALFSAMLGTLFYTLLFTGFKYVDYRIYNSEYPDWNHLRNALVIGAILSLIFAFIQIALRLNRAHHAELLAKERIKNELTQANLTILNQQLDPHFLFNNFNTLYYLIDEDADLAKRFLKNMSGIYRHILQNHRQGLIDARREYQVARQYLDILSARYDRALHIEEQVSEAHLQNKMLPPLVLQQLLENIIKHNQIDPGRPLSIMLTSQPDVLTVTNTRMPLASHLSTGYGLDNIIARYRHLGPRTIGITATTTLFTVQVPLL